MQILTIFIMILTLLVEKIYMNHSLSWEKTHDMLMLQLEEM